MRQFLLIVVIGASIILGILAFVVQYDSYLPFLLSYLNPFLNRSGLSFLAFTIAIISIIWLTYEKIRIDPHIRKIWLSVELGEKTNEYKVLAEISNEGGRKAKTHCYVSSMDAAKEQTIWLQYAPVDTPAGRVNDQHLPKEDQFILYPKKPIYVRNYITPNSNGRYQVTLEIAGNKIKIPKEGFIFPDWHMLRNLQRQRTQKGLGSVEPF